MKLLRSAVLEQLRIHPRILQQHAGFERQHLERLAEELPPLIPFRRDPPQSLIAVLDWDHRLPSRSYTLRLHLHYSVTATRRFEAAFDDRLQELQRRDLYPEFDIPDFSELPSDECYEAQLTAEFGVEAMRLVSQWRRDLPTDIGNVAIETVRRSREFSQAEANAPWRPQHLGDLHAVGWTPPCESGHTAWTIDVWWLTAFDGRTGRGWSFLVDTASQPARVVSHREFSVRA